MLDKHQQQILVQEAVLELSNVLQKIRVETTRPSALMRPALSGSSGLFRAQYGVIIGTGDTPEAAMRAFDLLWQIK